MEYKYLTYNCDSFYFKFSALGNYEGAKAEWEAVVANYEKRKAESMEKTRVRKQGWDEFVALKQKYNVNLSTRQMNTLKLAFIPTTSWGSSPSLWAWLMDGDVMYKADASNGYTGQFDKAYDLVKTYYERKKKLEAESKDMFKKAIEYCTEKMLPWTVDDALDVARCHMADEIRNKLEGETIEIDCCDECSHWTVGERRCSCGNRRISLVIDGEFPNLYYYAEAF